MKIAHFADVHLGVTTYGKLNPFSGLNTRVMDFLDTFDCMIEAMEAWNPDLILFAGDAYRIREPANTLITHMANRMVQLANIAPVIAVVGNHDRQRKGDEKKHAIEVWEELSAAHEIIVAQDIHGYYVDNAYIVTLPWFYDKPLDEILDDLDAALARTPREDIPTILVGHVGIDGAQLSTGYEYEFQPGLGQDFHMPLDVFCDPELWDYVALGHVHLHQCLCDNPPVVYSGSLDRMDWGERNDPGKGFVVADVERGNAKWKFVDLSVRPMVDLRVPLSKLSKLGRVNVTDAIVRITVTVDSPKEQYKVVAKVLKYLPDDYHNLDSILVEMQENVTNRRKDAQDYSTGMPVMDALETYLVQKFGDVKYVDDLLDAAEDLLEGELDE